MSMLIHLNGPPGVGKSTVARLWVDQHPGVLNLDGDAIVALIGGWRDNFWNALGVARRLAAAMAFEHLRAGNDVVLPQLVTAHSEIAPYLDAVRMAGATYVEVALLADGANVADRREERARRGEDQVALSIDTIVNHHGGNSLLAKIRRDLFAYLDTHDNYISVDTDGANVATTYDAVARAVTAHTPD